MAKAIVIYENTYGSTETMAKASYGQSGESVEMLSDTMKHIFGMEMIEPGLKLKGTEVLTGEKECKEFGKKIAMSIKEGRGK